MVLVLIAYSQEIHHFLNKYKCFELIENKLYKLYKYKDILISISGIGQTNMAFALTNILSRYSISQIINIGFAGSLDTQNKTKIGSICFAKSVRNNNFDISIFDYKKGEIPGSKQIYYLKYLYYQKIFKKNNIKTCTFPLLTSNIFINCHLQLKNNIHDSIYDMECFTISQICEKYKIFNITSIKIITDLVCMDCKKTNKCKECLNCNKLNTQNQFKNSEMKCVKIITRLLDILLSYILKKKLEY